MSEKSVESTGLATHELLDWDVLKDFDPKKPRVSKETLEDAREIEQKSRKKRQSIGRRALGVVEKFARKASAPEVEEAAEEVEEAAAGETQDDRLALENYEVVTNRAVQAIGQERFQKVVEGLDKIAADRGIGEVMGRFRELAGAARMDAGDLWDAVLMQAKAEKYGKDKDRIKFYYTTDLTGFERILSERKVARQDGGTGLLESDIKLAADYDDEGEWKSGYKPAKKGDITLVFDGSVLDTESFVALGKEPTIGEIDLEKSCLGVVTGGDDYDGKPVTRILKNHDKALFPTYMSRLDGEVDWEKVAFGAEDLRQVRDEWREAEKRQYDMEQKVFTDVNYFELGRAVRPYAERITEKDVMKIVWRNMNLETKEERDLADENLVKYFAEILDLETVPGMEYIYVPGQAPTGLLKTGKDGFVKAVIINRAKVDGADLRRTIEVISHEMRHAKQRELKAQANDTKRSRAMSEKEKERAALYTYNFKHYVKAEVDPVEYKAQLVEAEARRFSELVLKKFDKGIQDSQKPMATLRRRWDGWKRGKIYQGKHEVI